MNLRGIDDGSTNGNKVVIRNNVGPSYNSGPNIIIAPGNDVGPIGTAANSTSPWANVSH